MTIYLDENKFNDLTKSPLRIKVLESLAIKGKLSKSMVESLFSKMHYYPDISNAFDNLLQNSLIEGAGKKVGRGRPEVFYRITDEGLALIIYKYHHDPKKFWSLLTGFCYHRDEQVSLDRVDEFYSLFVNKHLKYPSGYNYFFQLDLFSKMSDKWIQDNAKNKNKISLEQKVIETLSMYPAIALNELVKRIKEPRQEKVIKVLDRYTMKKLHYTDTYDTDAQYLDLMHHCIVTVGHTAKGVETYELSLFGIIIAMTLVRYHEMGRIGSLFYNGILLQDYYNKIASNYKYALPLIFGKWYLLKTHLRT